MSTDSKVTDSIGADSIRLDSGPDPAGPDSAGPDSAGGPAADWSSARSFGAPLRYVQGPGELDRLPGHAAPWARRILAVIDPSLFGRLSARLEAAFRGTGSTVEAAGFGGECSEEEIARLAAEAARTGAEAVAGLGGGRTLDAAKLVGAESGLPVMVAPTSASTDGAVSALAVVRGADDGRPVYRRLPHAPVLAVVDSAVIARAPLRLFVAGIGDALSTWPEANASFGDPNPFIGGRRPCLAGRAMAEACHRAVRGTAAEAVRDLAAGRLTEAVEGVVEAVILLSGLGFENCGCAAAHALAWALAGLPGADGLLHGEAAAFGALFQLAVDNEQALEGDMAFMASLGLPICLADMGLALGEDEIGALVGRLAGGAEGERRRPLGVELREAVRALRTVDSLGRSIREGTPELRPALCGPA